MAAKGGGIAENDEFEAGAGNCHVRAPQVGQETNLTAGVGAHQREDYHVALAPLKGIYRVDCDLAAQGTQVFVQLDKRAQVLHLCAVGRNDAETHALLHEPVPTHFLRIAFERGNGGSRLFLIDAPEGSTHKRLVALTAIVFIIGGDVYPRHRFVQLLRQRPPEHFGRSLKPSAVKPFRRKAHQSFVHAILHGEQPHRRRVGLRQLLGDCGAQTAAQCLGAFHGGRQLLVVAGEDHAVGLEHGNPAGGFERLRRLVDKERMETAARHHGVARAGERGSDDPRIVEERVADTQFQLVGTLAQAINLLVEIRAALPPRLRHQGAQGAAYLPQGGIVGMFLKPPLVGVGKHLRRDARGVADAQHGDAPRRDLRGNPVDRRVALRAHQHLRLSAQHFAHRLDQRGGLARARRAVHHEHLTRVEDIAHRLLLCRVEPRQPRGTPHGGGR